MIYRVRSPGPLQAQDSVATASVWGRTLRAISTRSSFYAASTLNGPGLLVPPLASALRNALLIGWPPRFGVSFRELELEAVKARAINLAQRVAMTGCDSERHLPKAGRAHRSALRV